MNMQNLAAGGPLSAGELAAAAVSPLTKAARQERIAAILAQNQVRSQEELAELLAGQGVRVAQATLSRDLGELGAVRLRGRAGELVYALPGQPGGPGSRPGGLTPAAAHEAAWPPAAEPASAGAGTAAGHPPYGTAESTGGGTLARIAGELLVSAEASANLVVLRTPAGGAQLLASAIDHAGWPPVLGTVAGDDTVLLISRDPAGGDALAQALLRLAERRPESRRP